MGASAALNIRVFLFISAIVGEGSLYRLISFLAASTFSDRFPPVPLAVYLAIGVFLRSLPVF